MAITKFESLPYDLLFQVVHLLSVADILRLRQVSQKFRRLTYERTVWDNAYRKSSILRPPGPFPSQSSAHLEHELKKCMKLHANWTSPQPRPVSRRTLNLGDNEAFMMTLALGRYLLVVGEQDLNCYDLDSSGEEHISRPIASYDLHAFNVYYNPIVDSSVDEREHAVESQLSIVCALLCSTEHQTRIILFDLHISNDSARFELRGKVLVPNVPFFNSGTLIGNVLLVDGIEGPAVLHIPTCQLYYLPPYDVPPPTRKHFPCFLTPTHLMVRATYFLEAFLLPDGVRESSETNTQQRAVLTRSYILYRPFSIGPMLYLSSHTTHDHSSSSEDQHGHGTTSMTFFSQATRRGRTLDIGFLDIVLHSGEGKMTKSFTPGPRLDNRMHIGHLFTGTVQRGCARITASTGLHMDAITVSVGEGGRSIIATELDIEEGEGEWAWDGLRGRLCRFVSETCIEIHDYV